MSVSFFGGRRGDGNDEGETKATDEKSERPGRDTMNLRQVHGRPQRFHEPDDFSAYKSTAFPVSRPEGRTSFYIFFSNPFGALFCREKCPSRLRLEKRQGK